MLGGIKGTGVLNRDNWVMAEIFCCPTWAGGVLHLVVNRGIEIRDAAMQPPQHRIIQSNRAIALRLRNLRLSLWLYILYKREGDL